jgi:hypothetical protein
MRDGKPYGRRSSDQAQFCPKCHNSIEPGHMESHMFHAHGEDRRQTEENKTPPPPERKPKQQQKTQPVTDGEPQKKKGNPWFRRPE